MIFGIGMEAVSGRMLSYSPDWTRPILTFDPSRSMTASASTAAATPKGSLLLYAVYDSKRCEGAALRSVLSDEGVHERPVRVIDCGTLCVLASPVTDTDALASPSVEQVLAFKSVVDGLFQGGPVVPLRFGTVVSSREQAVSLIAQKETIYADLLGRLNGQVEMGVRLQLADVEPVEEPAGPPYRDDRPGTAYLLARQKSLSRAERRRRAAVRPFREALEPFATEVSTSPGHDAEASVSMAFLIPHTEEDGFRDAVSRVKTPNVASVDVVGPWAPYSFV